MGTACNRTLTAHFGLGDATTSTRCASNTLGIVQELHDVATKQSDRHRAARLQRWEQVSSHSIGMDGFRGAGVD
jgi:hypothetical protein